MVQLDEKTSEDSAAHQAGFKTIQEVSRERSVVRAKAYLLKPVTKNWNKDVISRTKIDKVSNMADVLRAGCLDKAKFDLFVDNIKPEAHA